MKVSVMSFPHKPVFHLAFMAAVFALPPTVALAIKSGDVVVIKQDADMKVSGKVVGRVKAGEMWKVHGVRGAWVEVGEKTKGWVRTDNVLGEQAALEHVSKLIDEEPGEAKLWITRARMRMSTQGLRGEELSQRLKAAEADLREARKQAPANGEVRYYQALIELRRSELDEALTKLNEAIDLNDKDARFFAERARLLMRNNRETEAMQDLEQVVALKAADAWTYNALAWRYATDYDSTVRDGAKAVKYATEACELTHYNNFAIVDTLAAACAEANDFPGAIRWQTEAIRICNDPGQKRSLEAKLKQYRLNQPYRE
jgi:tetratricopeptide (TPR) repeat protein